GESRLAALARPWGAVAGVAVVGPARGSRRVRLPAPGADGLAGPGFHGIRSGDEHDPACPRPASSPHPGVRPPPDGPRLSRAPAVAGPRLPAGEWFGPLPVVECGGAAGRAGVRAGGGAAGPAVGERWRRPVVFPRRPFRLFPGGGDSVPGGGADPRPRRPAGVPGLAAPALPAALA